MTLILAGLFVLLPLLIWLRIDYTLGRKEHLKTIPKKSFSMMKTGEIDLLINGKDFYDQFYQDVSNSTSSIHILFYIIRDDAISHELFLLLERKAKEGIEVRLMVDFIGASKMKKKSIQMLRDAGVQFAYSHKPRFPFIFYTLQARNHRKITVIDGKIGYLGGFNIGEEYLGNDAKMGFWRDYHLKISGQGVKDLQSQFFLDWEKASKEKVEKKPLYFPLLEEGSIPMNFLSSYGRDLEEHFIEFIQKANRELFICTPYFIPGKPLQKELIKAAQRGVKIKIMVPSRKDHPFVTEAAFPYYGPLLAAGCEIYRFYYGFYHVKTIIVDDQLCDIGTANFDKRSLFLNDEINCLIYSKSFISAVKQTVLDDMKDSEQLTMEFYENRPISQRAKEKFATAISHFL
ncbi:cardiolipin synthase [Metabacillus arenae]|uniref:Cardiolipin synthase n=1 Tax=Metabacillus arenae TaxID=2771434 RepID=A0A926NKW9_9BACI|nr:cardiolipin synthase [Metabacillus arenae]MBD1379701.1 cardiolipin synthase [Metabacillus arenae]